MTERIPAIKVLLLPKDTNGVGTIFGGVILVAHRPAPRRSRPGRWRRTVTSPSRCARWRSTRRCSSATSSASTPRPAASGATSVTVGVEVEVERWSAGHQGERVTVTAAEVVLVAIDAERQSDSGEAA